MTSQQLRNEIDIKRPRYLTKYLPLIEAISNKGTTKGGDYIRFGPYFQTYMYAFMIGYHIGECDPIIGAGGEAKDFAPFGDWKPRELVDFILMNILNESEEKIGFQWIDLESMADEEMKKAVSDIIRRIEGYANVGFSHLQQKFDNEKDEFRDPYVFINILRKVISAK